MKKLISYSLYGVHEKYLIGALRNAEQASKYYPDWITRFYVGRTVKKDIIDGLIKLGAEIVLIDGKEDASAMFWRYRAFFDVDVSVVIVRDTDSRFSLRESDAVKFWLDSGKGFHIMRDHPAHYCPILGGLLGVRTERIVHLKKLFDEFGPIGFYGEDQNFLKSHVYPLAKNDAVIHDSFFLFEQSAIPFSIVRDGLSFVGEVFDENDMPRIDDRNILKMTESSIFQRLRLKCISFFRGFN